MFVDQATKDYDEIQNDTDDLLASIPVSANSSGGKACCP